MHVAPGMIVICLASSKFCWLGGLSGVDARWTAIPQIADGAQSKHETNGLPSPCWIVIGCSATRESPWIKLADEKTLAFAAPVESYIRC